MANVRLAGFLIDLATNQEFRERFHKDPVGTLDSLATPLSPEARQAVLEANAATIFDMLAVNNQANIVAGRKKKKGGGKKTGKKTPAKKPGRKKPAKKTSKKPSKKR